ncbi:MAG: methylenetetrahydrofolate reductase [Lachnospiraceae bacterium]|nr:methylenetetrahydrofolate reductase [NAD(P)H] [Lachnospiraceae bacterium]
MKISEILKSKAATLSFEVFPPKTSDKMEDVSRQATKIAALSPDFMSVTYGAGGGTSDYTVDIAALLQKTYQVPMLAHLTCVSSTKERVREMIAKYKERGIENIMALRGDIPAGGAPHNEYHHATELIADIKSAGDFCIGGACYPEGHPEADSREEDLKYLKEKADAGCDFLTSQMFFNNDLFYNFLYRARDKGIMVPIVAGIMPITNAKMIRRSIEMSGAELPERFRAIVDFYGHDPDKMKQAGIIYATEQIVDLLAHGVKNIHVYSMNKPDIAEAIQRNLSEILK